MHLYMIDIHFYMIDMHLYMIDMTYTWLICTYTWLIENHDFFVCGFALLDYIRLVISVASGQNTFGE